MFKRFQLLAWSVLAAGLAFTTNAWTPLGPPETWQVAALGYTGGWPDAPHNLSEEYRWNIPVIYYTYDQAFLDYFGSNAVAQVDLAAAQLNSVLTNKVSSLSPDLSEFPLQSSQINFTAAARHLFDLRSCVYELMMERLGLAGPQPFVWTLHSRIAAPACPSYIYSVVQRNFDPITFEPSAYINGVLFTYYINEMCPAVDEAVTVPTPVDVAGSQDTSVASGRIVFGDTTFYGRFYTGLTRDDVGGLRYLYQPNNINQEIAGPTGTTTYVTNTTGSELLYTSNLVSLANDSRTNSDAALAALYPNAVFGTPAISYWTNVWTTNVTAYITNSPFAPIGAAGRVVYLTNVTESFVQYYAHSFANLYVPKYSGGAWHLTSVSDITTLTQPSIVTLRTTTISAGGSPFTPVGSTNLVAETNELDMYFASNIISGEYFFMPTGLCSALVVGNLATLTNTLTNLIYSTTNSYTNSVLSSTNALANTNVTFRSQSLVTYSTNHVFAILPVTCPSNFISARQGMDSVIRLQRQDYDSLLNRFWAPVTNTWTAIAVTNNLPYVQTMSRVSTAPDLVMSAQDLLVGGVNLTVQRSAPTFDTNGVPNLAGEAIAGPGTIQPNALTSFIFNKVGNVYGNVGPGQVDQASASTDFQWGSFDGSTNAPIIYPLTSSISGYQNQVLLQSFPSSLPDGTFGVPYTFSYVNNSSGVSYTSQFSGAGGQAPYLFSVTPGFSLPAGLTLGSDGTFSGTPAAVGAFSLSLRMTDFGARTIDTPYTLNINPP